MKVLLFGIAREIVGEQRLSVTADHTIDTVGKLKSWMKEKYPALKELSTLAVAVDNEYAEDDALIETQNEVAIIPPVSGG